MSGGIWFDSMMSGPTWSLSLGVQVLFEAINGEPQNCPSLTSVGCWLQIITGGARQQQGWRCVCVCVCRETEKRWLLGVWVVVSWCRSRVGFLVPVSPPQKADLSLYIMWSVLLPPPFVAQFRSCIVWTPLNILELDLVQERIDGGLAILAILILDLQNKGTDWGGSPVLQGY